MEVKRLSPDVPPPPTYIKSGRLAADRNIDRWQIIDYTAPSFIRIHVGGAPVGTGALEGRYELGLNLWVLNAVTPETETTSNYFWASVRCHAIGDTAADHLFLTQVGEAFEEDRRVLEAQQRAILEHEDSWSYALQADSGSIQARRQLDRLLDNEQVSDGRLSFCRKLSKNVTATRCLYRIDVDQDFIIEGGSIET